MRNFAAPGSRLKPRARHDGEGYLYQFQDKPNAAGDLLSGECAVLMNVLEVAVFAMVVLGPNQKPFNCEVSIGGVRCSHGIAAFLEGVNDIVMSDGIKVVKSPKGELQFSNGIVAKMDSLGWVQFSNGVAVRRETSEKFRFSTGMVCRFTAMGRAGCSQEARKPQEPWE
jgi:hypothetical protein